MRSWDRPALTVEPPSWKASEKPAHQIDLRQLLLDGGVVADRQYAFAGGRRQTDAVWTSSYDEFGRLTQIESATRRIVATYDPLGRIVGRSAYYLDGASWIGEDRQGVLDADGLPANVTFVWDAVSDRLVEIAEAGASMQTAAPPDAGLLRQYVHGDQAYDDLVEVLAATARAPSSDATFRRAMRPAPARSRRSSTAQPATSWSAFSTVTPTATPPRYLQGPVVDKITADITKDGSGTVEKIEFHVHLSEKLQAASVGSGISVRAVTTDGFETGPPAGTASVDAVEPFTATIKLTGAEWQSLQTAPNAASIRVAVTSQLRAEAWGDTPVSPAPAWAVKLYGITTTTALPFATRESLSTLSAFVSSAPPATKTDYPTIYSLPNLYLAGAEQSKTKLFTGFKAAPFIEPATGFAFFRERWYDASTGTWLSPDPVGYRDSANLYSYCAGDPVNCTDPLGTERLSKRTLELVNRQAASPELRAAVRAPAVQGSAAAVRDKMTGAVIGLVPGSENVGLMASAARVVNATRRRGIRGGVGAAFDEWKNQLKGLPFVNWYFEGEAASEAAAAHDEYAEAYHRVSLGINAASDTAFVIGGAEAARANGVPSPVRTARSRVSASTGGEFANDFRAVEQPFDFRTAYRYVGEGEAKVIRATGRVPNVSLAGTPKNISLTPQLILSGSEAEEVLRMGRFNPVRPYPGPLYGIEVDISGVRLTYAGNSAVGAFGIELQTTDSPLALRIFRLNQ